MNGLAVRARALALAAAVALALAVGVSHTLEPANGDWLLLTAAGIVAALLVDAFTTRSTSGPVNASTPPLQTILAPLPAETVTVETLAAPANVVVHAPKLGNQLDENEDAYAIDVQRGCYVVADGAASSFASRAWAHALCDAFVEAPSTAWSFGDFTTRVAVAEGVWRDGQRRSSDAPWWAEEGLRRGAHATIAVLTLRMHGGQTIWRASAVGDSCVFQLRLSSLGWAVIRSMPLEDANTFGGHPSLVHTGYAPTKPDIVFAEGTAFEGDVFVLATDAVAEWILRDPTNVASAVQSSTSELQGTFDSLRRNAQLANDDVTLVRVAIRS